jgi:hypothetical protein
MVTGAHAVAAITLDSHIEITPGTRGDKPRIAGRRIRVHDIAIWHERMGMSAKEVRRVIPMGPQSFKLSKLTMRDMM